MTTKQNALPEWAAPADLGELYRSALPLVLDRAARSPFYSARFGGAHPRTMADFAALPLTSKQDLRDAYPFGLLAVPRRDLATYHESSGTSGHPTPSYYTENDWEDLIDRYARKWVGIYADDTFLVRTPYALMITGHLAHASARARGATVVPGDNRSLAMPISRVLRTLVDLQVSLTWSMPTETLLWAAAARLAGLDPARDFPALRALFVGGEPLSPLRRERMSLIWGVPVVEEYGSTETGSLAGQCPEGALHLWADRALFEVFDPGTQQLTRTGVGQLVVTPLLREAMPLVRYNLEDTVEVADTSCPCGWDLPTVTVHGRCGFGYSVAGAVIFQTDVEDLVFSLPAQDGVMFWRGRAQEQELLVEIEVTAKSPNAVAAKLERSVRDRLGVPCRVLPLPSGGLVPEHVLTSASDVMKPRSLFGPDESWDKAHVYF